VINPSIEHKHLPTKIIAQLSDERRGRNPQIKLLYKIGLNDQKVPSEILPDFLYLGSVSAAQNWEGLQERKITDVLCMVSMHQLPFTDKLKYKLVKIDDIQLFFSLLIFVLPPPPFRLYADKCIFAITEEVG
jgi:hypothetical protein